MSQLTPSLRRYEKNRQAILDAARVIIMEQGVSALSMRSLANQVDYSPSALYKYFADKEELLGALTQEGWTLSDEFHQRHPPEGNTPVELLIRGGLSTYQFAQQYPAHYQLMMSATKPSPQSLAEFKEHPQFKTLLAAVAELSANGQLLLPKGFTSDDLSFLLWFSIHGATLLRQSMMSHFGEEFDALMEQLAGAMIRLLSPEV